MMYVKADDESILPYGEEVQRRQTAFLPLDLSTVVLGIGIRQNNPTSPTDFRGTCFFRLSDFLRNVQE